MPSFKIIGLLVLEKKDFAIYSHGGHHGHGTLTTYISLCSPFTRMLLVKYGFVWPSDFREDKKIFEYYGNTEILSQERGGGAD